MILLSTTATTLDASLNKAAKNNLWNTISLCVLLLAAYPHRYDKITAELLQSSFRCLWKACFWLELGYFTQRIMFALNVNAHFGLVRTVPSQ